MSGQAVVAVSTPPQAEREPVLAVGRIDGERLRSFMLTMWLPALIVLLIGRNGFSLLVFCGALPLSFRLARLHGDPEMVTGATRAWQKEFVMLSLALLCLGWLGGRQNEAYGLLGLAYFYQTVFRRSARRLARWQPFSAHGTVSRHRATAPEKVPDPQLGVTGMVDMRNALDHDHTRLASLEVFDPDEADLQKAWRTKNLEKIAERLQAGEQVNRASARYVNGVFNSAQATVDRVRHRVNELIAQTEQRLKPFALDYRAIEVERSKRATIEVSRSIPGNLSPRRIELQTRAFTRTAATSLANTALRTSSVMSGPAAIFVSVAAFTVYYARTVRKLKEVEGQLSVDAAAIRGDGDTVDALLTARILPQMDGLIDVATKLEAGLAALPVEILDQANEEQRRKAYELAFTVVYGRHLVATRGGDG